MSTQNDIKENLDADGNPNLSKLYMDGSLLECEIQAAKELIKLVEKCETELQPAIDLVSNYRKRLREGLWKPQCAEKIADPPSFFPTKKFRDNLKSNSVSQKELKNKLFVVESKLLLLSDVSQQNKSKNREQDKRIDEILTTFMRNDAVLKTMKSEMEKYNKRGELLIEKIETNDV